MARIGLCNLCHEDYLDHHVMEMAQKTANALREYGHEVVESEPLGNYQTARETGIRFAGEKLDGVILFLGAWMECTTAMAALREIEHLPLFLWGFPMFEEEGKLNSTGSYVSYAMFRGSMKRAGYRFLEVMGLPDEEKTVKKANCFAVAAGAVTALKRSRIGLIGYSSMNIYPGTFDHLFLRTKIGPEVEQIDSYTLINMAESVSKEDRALAIDVLQKKGKVCADVTMEALGKAAGIYAALQELCSKKDFDAINIKCQYEFSKEYKMVPCVPLSALADSGIVSACEGDVLCTVSMLILSLLTKEVVAYGDAINHIENTLKLSSCGMLPFSMGKEPKNICKFMPHDGFHGIQSSYVMKEGKVTAMRLIEDCGSYHLLYFTGRGLATELRQGYMPALDIELDGNIETLLKEYSGQHFAIAYGDQSEKLETICALLNIPVIRV